MWLSAPRERHVRAITVRIPCPESSDLASLPVKIASQFSRNIDNSPATAVVAHVHEIVFNPHVVRATFGHRILSDFLRMINVRDVDDVTDSSYWNPFVRVDIEEGRQYFITYEQVVMIAEYRVSSRQPAVTIKIMMVETELTNQLRMLRAATFQSRTNIQNHESFMPVREISESVLHVQIMEITSGNFFTFFRTNHPSHRAFSLPTRYLLRILCVSEVDHSH